MKKLIPLLISSILLILLGIAVGPVRISLSEILASFSLENIKIAFSSPNMLEENAYIILQIRLPRIILAYLVG
ncbi:MAG: iron ABC transporter permease, partial [Thermococcus sp.]|nr:iron ABC transporter permease [Thermococcus sp.]